MMGEKTLTRAALVALTLGLVGLGYRQQWAQADGIPTVNPMVYSGTLEEAGSPVTGTRAIDLRLFDDAVDATPAHLRCVTSSPATSVVAGRFQIPLNDTCTGAIHAAPNLWLQIDVAGAPLGRTRLSAVPFAVEAERANGLAPTTPAPVLRGSVTTGASDAERVERAYILYAGGVPSVSSQSGSWIGAVTDTATGDSSLNLAAGVFSAQPACVVSVEPLSMNAGTGTERVAKVSTTPGSVRVYVENGEGTAIDPNGYYVVCMGPR